jgi:hypothetical protein
LLYDEFGAQLIKKDGARVVLDKGEPAIELTPNKEYLNEIKLMQNTLYDMSQEHNDGAISTYVV